MKVLNVHERIVQAPPERAGALIDTLASRDDRLFPRHTWPRMEFDRPLGIGAAGGHGPIRYFVEEYAPGRSIRFRFTGPRGFDGWHGFEASAAPAGGTLMRHTLQMDARGFAAISWTLLYRPLHDALIEDGFATAQASLGETPVLVPWSAWVKALRNLRSRGRARPQTTPAIREAER